MNTKNTPVPVRKGQDGFMVRFNKPKFRGPTATKSGLKNRLASRIAVFDAMRTVGAERDGKTMYVSTGQKNVAMHRPGSNKK